MFSRLFQALEQEKHLLRRRLQTTEEENEARLLELQSDVRDLTAKLDQRENSVKQVFIIFKSKKFAILHHFHSLYNFFG